MVRLQVLWIGLLLLGACSNIQQSQQEKIKQANQRKDLIYRSHDESHYAVQPPIHRVREPYPWEQGYAGRHPKITKEAFRCKGSLQHSPRAKDQGSAELVHDCGGVQKHSLPVQGSKEFIYQVLIDILNYLQAKTGYPVVITCGHRCPAHNTYADGTVYNQSSKHMIGAEVDFYIDGMENKPEEVIDLIMQYYKETPPYKGNKEYERFLRLEHVKVNVSTPPWHNKEILIKLYKKDEGRDLDNQHPYPYVSLQVRYDREKNEKVTYSWEKAFNGYMRY
jgi:hypothetical protein